MAYIVRHIDKDGKLNIKTTDHHGTIVREGEYYGGVATASRPSKIVNHGYNLHPSGSAQIRKAEIGAELNEIRKEYTHTNGFSKGRTIRHVAHIPAESWAYVKSKGRGDALVNNQKEMKRYCQEQNFNVVPNDSW